MELTLAPQSRGTDQGITPGDRGHLVRYRTAQVSKDGALSEDTEAQGWATAKTLAEALPYIQIYDRETVVIKYGGHAMGEESEIGRAHV